MNKELEIKNKIIDLFKKISKDEFIKIFHSLNNTLLNFILTKEDVEFLLNKFKESDIIVENVKIHQKSSAGSAENIDIIYNFSIKMYTLFVFLIQSIIQSGYYVHEIKFDNKKTPFGINEAQFLLEMIFARSEIKYMLDLPDLKQIKFDMVFNYPKWFKEFKRKRTDRFIYLKPEEIINVLKTVKDFEKCDIELSTTIPKNKAKELELLNYVKAQEIVYTVVKDYAVAVVKEMTELLNKVPESYNIKSNAYSKIIIDYVRHKNSFVKKFNQRTYRLFSNKLNADIIIRFILHIYDNEIINDFNKCYIKNNLDEEIQVIIKSKEIELRNKKELRAFAELISNTIFEDIDPKQYNIEEKLDKGTIIIKSSEVLYSFDIDWLWFKEGNKIQWREAEKYVKTFEDNIVINTVKYINKIHKVVFNESLRDMLTNDRNIQDVI